MSASSARRSGALFVTRVLQPLTMFALAAVALPLTGAALLCASGVIGWPEVPLMWNGAPVPHAGAILLVAAAVLSLGLLTYLPANGRIMALETSHRNFRISMHDVAHAYHTAHAADREGTFRMSHEFDAVRERIAFLRDHPDLGGLEPAILEAAAQMSRVSQELAETYSDEKVARARAFLRQRQEEIAQFNDRIDTAKLVAQELRQWTEAVEMDEAVARSQMARLVADLDDLLPEMELGRRGVERKARPARSEPGASHPGGFDIPGRPGGQIVGLHRPAAE